MHYPAIVRGESNDKIGHWQSYKMEIFPDKVELIFRDSNKRGDYKVSIGSIIGALNFSAKDEKGEILQLSAGFDRTAQLCEVSIQRQTRDPANAYEEVLFQLSYDDDHAVVCKSFYPKDIFTYEVANERMGSVSSRGHLYDYTEF